MSKRTDDRMALRRETKFEKHGVEVVPESHSEVRRLGKGDNSYDWKFDFTHAVYVRGHLEGRAESARSALKKAHQTCRNLEHGGNRRRIRKGE